MSSGESAAAPPAEAPPLPPPPSLKRDRHIVTWTPQEDDLLRDHVAVHGTDNWTSIAAKFKDKTGRQCRRRWFTYLNTECKKGGWSPEEDMLLCEAQKVFGNRWTEIAKVVSGRTDNAVKNRFSTLCKKRAKHEVSSKENDDPCVKPYTKKVLVENGRITDCIAERSVPTRQIKYHISVMKENCSTNKRVLSDDGVQENGLRPPLAVLAPNINSTGGMPTRVPVQNSSKAAAQENKIQSAFFRRDDPKLAALLQQADMLSSLAAKVNTENSKQSLEDAWKELQDYLIQTEEGGSLVSTVSGMELLIDDFKDLIEDLRSVDTGCQVPLRGVDIHEESQGSSGCSVGTSPHLDSQGNKNVEQQLKKCSLDNDVEICGLKEDILHTGLYSGRDAQENEDVEEQVDDYLLDQNDGISGLHEDVLLPSKTNTQVTGSNKNVQQIAEECSLDPQVEVSYMHEDMQSSVIGGQVVLSSSEELKENDGNICTLPISEFNSPLQTMPLFRSLAEGIPSPKFSASERQFLLSVFGLSTPGSSPNCIPNPSCKRTLLDRL